MLFPKAILQAEFAAARCSQASVSDGGRSGRRSKSDCYHKKWGRPLAGRKAPRRETTHHVAKSLYRDVSNKHSLAHAQQPVSTHRPKLFFGQTFMFLDTIDDHPHAGGATGQACAGRGGALCRSASVSSRNGTTTRPCRFSLSGRRGDQPLGRLLSSQEFRMHGVEVFRLLQDFLVAEQPFLLAKLNPQLLKGSKYSTVASSDPFMARSFRRLSRMQGRRSKDEYGPIVGLLAVVGSVHARCCTLDN